MAIMEYLSGGWVEDEEKEVVQFIRLILSE